MTLIKFLINRLNISKAQAALEYFIIFAVIVGLAVLSASAFYSQAQRDLLGGAKDNSGNWQKAAKDGFYQKISGKGGLDLENENKYESSSATVVPVVGGGGGGGGAGREPFEPT